MAEIARPLSPQTDLDWCIGPPLHGNFATLLQSDDAAEIDTAVAHYRTRYSAGGLLEADLYPGIPAMLAVLKEQNFQLILATSKPTVFARQILAHFELDRFFDAVYGSELDGRNAAKTDLIHLILQQEKLSALQTMMVGDREHDMIGAKANDVWAGGVLYGYGRQHDLLTAGADTLFPSPDSIPIQLNHIHQKD
jgi:phosphoglycolate phosphatase